MSPKSPRYQRVYITVKITDTGKGLSDFDVEKICNKIEKIVKGKSKNSTSGGVLLTLKNK